MSPACLRRPDFASRDAQSFGRRAADHAAAGRRRRAGRPAARSRAQTRRRSGASLRSSISTSTAFSKRAANHRRTAFHLVFSAGHSGRRIPAPAAGWVSRSVFSLTPAGSHPPPLDAGGDLRDHAVRGGHSAQDLEQHAQREEAGGAGAAAGGGAPGGAHQPDQSALPVQYAELGLVADPHRSQPGARDGGAALQSAAPSAAQARKFQPAARRAELHRGLSVDRGGALRRQAAL